MRVRVERVRGLRPRVKRTWIPCARPLDLDLLENAHYIYDLDRARRAARRDRRSGPPDPVAFMRELEKYYGS